MRRWAAIGILLGSIAGLLLCWNLVQPNAMPVSVSDSVQAAIPNPGNLRSPPASAPVAPDVVQHVESFSGVRIRLVRRHRIDSPSPPFGPQYAALYAAARAGDVAGQYRLGLMLYECRDVPADAPGLEQDIETTYRTHERGGFEVSDAAEEEQSLRRRFQECSGVPADERGRYRDWLKSAADAGLIEAELDLPLRLPQADYCEYLSECPPEQRARQEALQKEAVDYVGRARDAGSAAALWTIGGWYAEGEVLEENDVEAYANFRALDEINEAAGLPRRFDQMLSGLRTQLRAADLITAESRANEILANPNCCVVTP